MRRRLSDLAFNSSKGPALEIILGGGYVLVFFSETSGLHQSHKALMAFFKWHEKFISPLMSERENNTAQTLYFYSKISTFFSEEISQLSLKA